MHTAMAAVNMPTAYAQPTQEFDRTTQETAITNQEQTGPPNVGFL